MHTGLTIDRVSKSYGELRALDEVSLDVRPGELYGFVGSNGAGKTTTMRIVLGVLAADAGDVLLDGTPLDAETRRRFGYMPAERGLYPKMKVGEQLTYLARLHGLSAADAARSVTRWTDRLGVADRTDDAVDTLSTGNQQRVQLAAALVHDPEVLVLDEPFSGLDPVAVDVMAEVLADRGAAGSPVLFSSHQLDLVERLCDRVGIIASGRLVAEGTVDDLRAGHATQLEVGTTAPDSWLDEVPGASLVSSTGGVQLVRLDDGADDQALLAAALRHGSVTHFARRRPHLSELFRDAVTAA